jgi:hypothetical protein
MFYEYPYTQMRNLWNKQGPSMSSYAGLFCYAHIIDRVSLI